MEHKNIKFKGVRCTEVVLRCLENLKKTFPEDYPNDSMIFRAGVIKLHRWRFEKLDGGQEK